MPNIIFDFVRREIAGFYDLGRAGLADRYQNIALLYRSFKRNTGSWHEEIFLEHYGLLIIERLIFTVC